MAKIGEEVCNVVRINNLAGPLLSVPVDATLSVAGLKTLIEEESGISAAEQHLVLNTFELHDTNNLANAMASENCSDLSLVRRWPITREGLLNILGMDQMFRCSWGERATSNSDLHEVRRRLLEIAMELVRQLASNAGRLPPAAVTGNLSGFPYVRWEQAWGEITPSLFESRNGGSILPITGSTLVASRHCNIIVRISNAAQKLLQAHGAENIEDGVGSVLCPWTVTEGWRVIDIMYLRRYYPSGTAFQVISSALVKQFQQTFEVDRILEVVHCTPETLIYQMSFRAMEEDCHGDGGAYVFGSV